MAGKLFIISAPSGAGKTTLVQALLDRFGLYYALERVITYTSKQARAVELHGRDYYFLSTHEFEAKIAEGFFMEWSSAYNDYYGSPRHILNGIKAGKSYVLIIDRVGARQVADQCENAVLIWLYTHNLDELRKRLVVRHSESAEQIEQRLKLAQEEIALELREPLYQYHVLNNDFERALRRLKTIIKRELYGC